MAMADTSNTTNCSDTSIEICPDMSSERDDALSPFYALNYHFGMLLGVDDFATEQLYHHGKMRLHNAWLHRAGVVWGFGVELDQEHGEIRVKPGLALNASGQELHLDADACVNVAEWFLAHQHDEGFAPDTTSTGFLFNAHVAIRFKSCLTRQVPALIEPCDGGAGGTAYSRVFETVDIRLIAGKAPPPDAPPYHRLRVLFGLEDPVLPADQPVVDERTDILNLPNAKQPAAYLIALRKFAALDEIDLKPAMSSDDSTRLLYPAPGNSPVILADINEITLDRDSNSGKLNLTGGEVDVTVRPAHISTATIQELLCGHFCCIKEEVSSVSGPRVDTDSVKFEDNNITFSVDSRLHPASVTVSAFALTCFDDTKDTNGWKLLKINTVNLDTDSAKTVTLTFNKATLPDKGLVRLIVYGTGSTPLLGAELTPLAGAITDPPPIADHIGRDFIIMHKRS
jgi:hypothetical protein